MNSAERRKRYERIVEQLEELLTKCDDRTAQCATTAALLHHKVPGVSWTGFYFIKGEELIVDAYQGPVACQLLEQHTGVCWAAIDNDATQIVADVHAIESHIACDANSRSEVVVPIHDTTGKPIGVLDIDSHRPDHFDEVDGAGYESVVKLLEKTWNTFPDRA